MSGGLPSLGRWYRFAQIMDEILGRFDCETGMERGVSMPLVLMASTRSIVMRLCSSTL